MNTLQDDDKFFNTEFWRKVVVGTIVQSIILVAALSIGLMVSGKIDKVIELSESLNRTMTAVQTTLEAVIGVDPVTLQEKADALKSGAVTVGEGVGGAEVANRIGDALRKFKKAP